MEQVTNNKKRQFISKPLFFQSLKSLRTLWLILTGGAALIFIIVNLAIGSKNIFTNIDMNKVAVYIKDEDIGWLKVLGLLESMGFSLARIQAMSQLDLNSILAELIYKISGVLLPMIYTIIAANKLVVSQVNDGSMAYVLSTPTNRKTVVRTQFLFLLLSIIAMYIVITIFSIGSEGLSTLLVKSSGKAVKWIPVRTLLFCFGSFAAMFALSGICFGASCFFNKYSNSIAVGGGVSVLAFICCILGLFGNDAFVAVGIGVRPMYFFNYLSLFYLIDTPSISTFCNAVFLKTTDLTAVCFNWIWEIGILFVIGAVFAYIGGRRFVKKDLPL